jgi:hypothetical protein
MCNGGTADEKSVFALASGSIPIGDKTYATELRRKISELDRDLELAQEFQDSEREEELQSEKDAILKEIKDMVGRRGKLRQRNDPMKKARDSATIAIKRALMTIRKNCMGTLADHLEMKISLGNEILYNPETVEFWNTKAVVS